MNQNDVAYTRTEVESYLPNGWSLDQENPEGKWDAKKGSWRLTVYDTVDLSWPIEVTASAAAAKGRLEALRLAFDRAFRDRLGKPTRGLGLATSA